MTSANAAPKPTQIRVTRRSPAYWRVTIDHPPLNVMIPEMIGQFQDVITALEADEQVRVVVFDSAVDGYFLNHSDFTGNLSDLTSMPPGPTGLPPWPDFFVRLTRAPVASIALIRGRATGNGSELTLACDMSFASREKAILSQWEVGVGLVPGGGPMARLPRLIGQGRALDLILSGREVGAEEALAMGLVNRIVPDGTALDHAVAWGRELAALPQTCLRNDRRSTLDQWGLSTADAMAVETRLGLDSLASPEAASGASRFAGGAGRSGSTVDPAGS